MGDNAAQGTLEGIGRGTTTTGVFQVLEKIV